MANPQRNTSSDTKKTLPDLALHSRYQPIYDNIFDDLIAKLNKIILKR